MEDYGKIKNLKHSWFPCRIYMLKLVDILYEKKITSAKLGEVSKWS